MARGAGLKGENWPDACAERMLPLDHTLARLLQQERTVAVEAFRFSKQACLPAEIE
jgi:hypothetical protein